MSIAQLFMVKEAVHSVSIEHPNSCNCLTCKAANGNKEAMDEIMVKFAKDDLQNTC